MIWSSSDESIARVNAQGVVTGITPGTATVTAASVLDPEVTAQCQVTVLAAEYDLTGVVMDANSDAQLFAMDVAHLQGWQPVTPLKDDIDVISGTFYDPTDEEGDEIAFVMDSGFVIYQIDPATGETITKSGRKTYPLSDMTVLEGVSTKDSPMVLGVYGPMLLFGINGVMEDKFETGFLSMAYVLPSYGAEALVGVAYAGSFREGTTEYEVVYAIDDVGNFWLMYFDFTDRQNPVLEQALCIYTDLPEDQISATGQGVHLCSMVVSDIDTILFSRQNGKTAEIYLLEREEYEESGSVQNYFSAAHIADMGSDCFPAVMFSAVSTAAEDTPGGGWDDDYDDYDDYDDWSVMPPLGEELSDLAGTSGEDASAPAEDQLPEVEIAEVPGNGETEGDETEEAAPETDETEADAPETDETEADAPETDGGEPEIDISEPVNVIVGGTAAVRQTSSSGATSTVTVTVDEDSTNGLLTVDYKPGEVTLVSVRGTGSLVSINDRVSGTVTIGWACGEDSGVFTSGKVIAELVFQRRSADITGTEVRLTYGELADGEGVGVGALPEAEETAVAFYEPVVPAATPDVVTGSAAEGGEIVTETTAAPTASVSDGEASVQVSDSMGAEIVRQAQQNSSDKVVIAPEIAGEVTRTEVTIPAGTAAEIGEKTDADLVVETPAGDVTIPNGALSELDGAITVATEAKGGAVSVEVAADGEILTQVPGGIRAALPLGDGEVAVIVGEDGTETIVPKSLVDGGETYVLLRGSATVKIKDNSRSFTDMPESEAYVRTIDFVSSHELFQGTGAETFSPSASMDRAMMVTVLWRLESEAAPTAVENYSDVSASAWYAESVAWAEENGIANGYGNGIYQPKKAISRQEMVTMLYRYAIFAGMDTDRTDDLAAFADAGDVSGYAREAIAWAVANGIITGTDSGRLNPSGSASRAQVATVVMRLVALMVK